MSVTHYEEIAHDLTHFFGESLDPFRLISVPARHGVSLGSEQRVLEIVNAARGRQTLGAALSEATGRSESDLMARAGEALDLLALDPAPESSAGMDVLLAMVPALRSGFYHLERPEIDVALLLGWRFVVAATAPGAAPGLRRIASVFLRFNKLVGLVVRAQRPVRLGGPLRRPSGGYPEVALEVALVLRDAQRDPGRYSLSELLARHVRTKGAQRMLVLHELSRAGLEFE